MTREEATTDLARPAWYRSGIFKGRKNGLKTSTAAGSVLANQRWLELFILQSVRNHDWNYGDSIRWLLTNPHPITYRCRVDKTGAVQIECEEGLVGQHLKINWPAGYDPAPLITGMQASVALANMPVAGNA